MRCSRHALRARDGWDDRIATVRFSVRDSDGDEMPWYALDRRELDPGALEALREDLTGLTRRELDTRDIDVQSISFSLHAHAR